MKIDFLRLLPLSKGIFRFAPGLSILFAFIMTGCGEEAPAETDAEMKARIVGTWVLDDGPFSLYYMEKSYSLDGTSAGFTLNRQTGKRIDFTSRWEIRNGCLTGEVVTSSDPSLPMGATYSNQIIKLTNKQFIMIQHGTGRVTIKHRKGRFALF